ncbi:MAG: nuclear transport factor 2 family protein [Bacteroidota bacterium]
MKASMFFYVLTFVSFMTNGQVTNEFNAAIEKEVNQQLWQNFKTAFETRNATLFNSLHTDDVMRITPNGIRVGKQYKDRVSGNYARTDAPERKIDFWIEHRIYTGDNGYEVGYFRIISTIDGKSNEYFGRFSVTLRKVNGKWLIAQDWDTDQINGKKITATDFEKGTILNLK